MANGHIPHERPTAHIGCRAGESVILTPRPNDWSGFLASDLRASADFMAGDDGRDRQPSQKRAVERQ